MDLGLRGKVALVTGAGQGVGKQIALTLSEEGAVLVVNDLVLERAEAVAADIIAAGGKALAVKADIVNWQEVSAMGEKALDKFGRIDILVNNAGVPAPGPEGDPLAIQGKGFIGEGRANWAKFIDVNLYGTMNCTRVALDSMIEHKGGKIVSIISDAGRIGEPRMAAYAAGKAGILGFSKSVAKEIARYGINVNCVSLGTTLHDDLRVRMATRLQGEGLSAEEAAKQWDEMVAGMGRSYPLARAMGRVGLPSDAANAVAFLASEAAAWITGQVFSVDGGYCMAG